MFKNGDVYASTSWMWHLRVRRLMGGSGGGGSLLNIETRVKSGVLLVNYRDHGLRILLESL